MISSTLKEKIESLPAILSIQETADFFSTQPITVYRLIYKRKLPAWKDNEGNWCVARCDLDRFCSKNSNL
jgi:hypothetical protein